MSALPTAEKLLEMHCETLYIHDGQGDIVADNSPYPAERRACVRFHLGWNDQRKTHRFRQDIASGVRDRVLAWLKLNSPCGREAPAGLAELADIFGAAVDQIGIGPVYYASKALPDDSTAIAIDAGNENCLPGDYLQAGEIDFVCPCRAVVVKGRAVSICVTVRRALHSAEAGVDTVVCSRGMGYAGRVTAAWAAAVQAEGLVPFYSTSVDNTPSRRVAEKLELVQLGWELGVR
ncbi:MAG: hypothetical protein GKR89_26015 [Candidatus Latescibacteria bacterium]|nr:hypothetical protein [Candidatus Latescibacterota bacterium]